jgi:hypothetical protein
MMETRRVFLAGFAAVGVFTGAAGALFAGTPQKAAPPFPKPPEPADQQNPAQQDAAGAKDADAAKRAALRQNATEFRAGVEKLYQMAGQLKDDVSNTPTMDVFSVQMYKRTAEIEKLAKQLKARAKG